MIVKNTSSNSHLLNHQAPLKPYFLQGLQYARQLLQQLKKQKQADEHLQYSPINQKHTKFSSDVIIQQELKYHNQLQERDQRDRKEKKERKENNYIGLGDVERQQDKEIRRSNQNVLIKKNKKIRTQSLDDNDGGSSLKKTKYKLSDHQDNTSMVVYEQYEDNNNKSSKFAQFSQLYNNTGPQQTAQSQFYSQLRQKQQKINWTGEQLQSLNSQIQSYETIFDNLCDCYRANQHISTKNHKLRRQAIRLQQEKSQILAKIANIGQQMRAFEQMEKQANQFVGVNVENYVRELIMYNQDLQIDSISVDGKVEVEYQGVKDNEEAGNSSEQEFEKKLTLNYKKLKERYQIKMKKKSTLQPKKLQKGVSFEQQIDVIAKFYQNQLTNI